MKAPSSSTPRTVLISGSTGLIGTALVHSLRTQGHKVRSLVRRPAREASEVSWDPKKGWLDPREIEGVDAVIHLAGENVAGGRWSASRKREIEESRVLGTTLLAETLAKLERRPEVLVSASAIGYYGDAGETVLTEDAPLGEGFLPRVCQRWEDAADAAREAGIRVAHPRIGVVLAEQGGALARMLLPFKLGMGGRLGDGQQWMSWIGLRDMVRILETCAFDERLSGPVNAVAPQAVRNNEFTKTLGQVLRRPTVAPVPAFALRALMGGLADELLLASVRVEPRALSEVGFQFEAPSLVEALRQALERAA